MPFFCRFDHCTLFPHFVPYLSQQVRRPEADPRPPLWHLLLSLRPPRTSQEWPGGELCPGDCIPDPDRALLSLKRLAASSTLGGRLVMNSRGSLSHVREKWEGNPEFLRGRKWWLKIDSGFLYVLCTNLLAKVVYAEKCPIQAWISH